MVMVLHVYTTVLTSPFKVTPATVHFWFSVDWQVPPLTQALEQLEYVSGELPARVGAASSRFATRRRETTGIRFLRPPAVE